MYSGKIVTLNYMRNEWKIYSYPLSTNTLISYAPWVILLDSPRQHDDASPPPCGLSWNIYGKFCLFVQTTEVSQFRPPSSPSPAFIFFGRHLGLRAQPKLRNLPHPYAKGVSLSLSLSHTGSFPMLTADWNSWPSPFSPFSHKSSAILIFRITNAIAQFLKVFITCPALQQTHPCCYGICHSSSSLNYLLPFLIRSGEKCFTPLQNANTQKGNGAIWIQQHLAPIF